MSRCMAQKEQHHSPACPSGTPPLPVPVVFLLTSCLSVCVDVLAWVQSSRGTRDCALNDLSISGERWPRDGTLGGSGGERACAHTHILEFPSAYGICPAQHQGKSLRKQQQGRGQGARADQQSEQGPPSGWAEQSWAHTRTHIHTHHKRTHMNLRADLDGSRRDQT